MSIDPARIEAAARAMMSDPQLWDVAVESYRDEWRDRALDVLEAAFPELVPEILDGLPHAWIAPWEATRTMAFACGTVTPSEAGRVWRKIRDAHLSREQPE